MLFILLGGYPPFYDENEPALFSQIRQGAFSFDDPVWDSVSDQCARSLCMRAPALAVAASGGKRPPGPALSSSRPWSPGSMHGIVSFDCGVVEV